MTEEEALFYLRNAAAQWLKEHLDSPNAANVEQALHLTDKARGIGVSHESAL